MPLPEFEGNDYIEVELSAEEEMRLEEQTGCRIIQTGTAPFFHKAIAVTDTISEVECNPFHRLPIENMWTKIACELYKNKLFDGARWLGLNLDNIKWGWYIAN